MGSAYSRIIDWGAFREIAEVILAVSHGQFVDAGDDNVRGRGVPDSRGLRSYDEQLFELLREVLQDLFRTLQIIEVTVPRIRHARHQKFVEVEADTKGRRPDSAHSKLAHMLDDFRIVGHAPIGETIRQEDDAANSSIGRCPTLLLPGHPPTQEVRHASPIESGKR